ncbi:MAG TPA: type I 3-dehydroquinate dehydratase, partial [Ktedonobacteraceae bacterium]|nr:type I 3-dehydroquinate dehydratase [Ktedonobacteraceae bacterium]
PLIITCRSPREGGLFKGTEAERLRILLQAIDAGCSYIDVEWDSALQLQRYRQSRTLFIVSRHWHAQLPDDLWTVYNQLREMGDVVKLAGIATRLADILPVMDILSQAKGPVIAIAMGQKGYLTRLLAPCFSHCLLTYAALTPEAITAPGQLSVDEMVSLYSLQRVTPATPTHIHLCPNQTLADTLLHKGIKTEKQKGLFIPVVVSSQDDSITIHSLKDYLPDLTISIDPLLDNSGGSIVETRKSRPSIL